MFTGVGTRLVRGANDQWHTFTYPEGDVVGDAEREIDPLNAHGFSPASSQLAQGIEQAVR